MGFKIGDTAVALCCVVKHGDHGEIKEGCEYVVNNVDNSHGRIHVGGEWWKSKFFKHATDPAIKQRAAEIRKVVKNSGATDEELCEMFDMLQVYCHHWLKATCGEHFASFDFSVEGDRPMRVVVHYTDTNNAYNLVEHEKTIAEAFTIDGSGCDL